MAVLFIGAGLAAWVNRDSLRRWSYEWRAADRLLASAQAKPDNLVLVKVAGRKLLAADRSREARDLLVPIAVRHSADAELNLLAGRAALAADDPQAAGLRLKAALDAAPTDPDTRYWMAVHLYGRGYARTAAELLQEVTELNERHAGAWRILGQIALDDDNLTTALEYLERAEALEFTAEGARERASALAGLGRLKEAEEMARRALALQPDAETYSLLGETVQGAPGEAKLREAQGYFLQALELAPDDLATANLLAMNHRALGEHAPAIKVMRRLLRRAPFMPDGYWLLAQSYRSIGKDELADETLRIYQQVEPLNEKVSVAEYQIDKTRGALPEQLSLIRTYLEIGREDLARRTILQTRRSHGDSKELDDLAKQAQGPPTLRILPLPVDPEGDAP